MAPVMISDKRKILFSTPACSCDVDHSLTEQIAWSVQDLESSQTRVRAEAAAD